MLNRKIVMQAHTHCSHNTYLGSVDVQDRLLRCPSQDFEARENFDESRSLSYCSCRPVCKFEYPGMLAVILATDDTLTLSGRGEVGCLSANDVSPCCVERR